MNEAEPFLRVASQWLLGVILAIVLSGLFLAVMAMQLTAAGTGQRILRRAVADTTQIDAVLPGIQAGLREAAQDSDGERVAVPDFPIPVELAREEAFQLQGAELRARLLDESARRLYQNGMSAWAAADPEAEQDIETISTVGALHWGLGLITEGNHTRLVIAASVLGALAVVLAILLISTVRSYTRLIALGAATLAAALPSLAAVIAIRFVFRSAEEEADPFVTSLLSLGVDSVSVPLRNYLALSALSFAVIGVAGFFVWWQARRPSPEPSAPLGPSP